MASTTYGNSATLTNTLRGSLVSRFNSMRARYVQWRLYRTTLNELTALSDRDLADIGINRGELRALAMETAYGK